MTSYFKLQIKVFLLSLLVVVEFLVMVQLVYFESLWPVINDETIEMMDAAGPYYKQAIVAFIGMAIVIKLTLAYRSLFALDLEKAQKKEREDRGLSKKTTVAAPTEAKTLEQKQEDRLKELEATVEELKGKGEE